MFHSIFTLLAGLKSWLVPRNIQIWSIRLCSKAGTPCAIASSDWLERPKATHSKPWSSTSTWSFNIYSIPFLPESWFFVENGCISNIRFLSTRGDFPLNHDYGRKGSKKRVRMVDVVKKDHLRGAQLVLPSAFQCDRSRIPQKGWPNVARFKKTNSICLTYSTCNLHEGLLFLFLLIWNLMDDFETKPNHFGDTNSFHPDLVWPFWRQIWQGGWVHDFIWRWVCNQVEDLIKHANGSKQDASLKYTCRNASILHRNSEIGT